MNNEKKSLIIIGVLIVIFVIITIIGRLSDRGPRMTPHQNNTSENADTESASQTPLMDRIRILYENETLLSPEELNELGLIDADRNMPDILISAHQITDIISFENNTYGILIATECTAGGSCESRTLFLVQNDTVTDSLIIAFNESSSGDISIREYTRTGTILDITTRSGYTDEFTPYQESILSEQYRINTERGIFEKVS